MTQHHLTSDPTGTDPGTALDGPALDGAAILDELAEVFRRYVVLPDVHALVAVVLWTAATHAQRWWAHAPRLVIRAPEKRCGKSRLLDLVEALCRNPLITVNASPAAVYRSITAADPPTILLDEADTVFGPAAGEANEVLRGILNAGHQRNRPARRYNAATNLVEELPTFAMAALAGIGAMPDTIEDRAVVIRMRRRMPGEDVQPFRVRRDRPALDELRARLTAWAHDNHAALEAAVPDMPVEDRAADTWEPLIAVADHAGGHWPDLARAACLALTQTRQTIADVPLTVRLLMDCRTAFTLGPRHTHNSAHGGANGPVDALATGDLLDRLNSDEEAPWATLGARGEGLNPVRLGRMLREYDITSTNIRFADGHQAKGYLRAAFWDAWARYCPPDEAPTAAPSDEVGQGTPENPSQPSQPSHRRSTRDGLTLWDGSWDGSTRPSTPTRPALTSTGTAGTAGTGSGKPLPPPLSPAVSPAVCIACRTPLTHDDGTHTHPLCS